MHLFNVKQKLKGKKCVTVEEFEQLTGILIFTQFYEWNDLWTIEWNENKLLVWKSIQLQYFGNFGCHYLAIIFVSLNQLRMSI